MVAKNNIKQIPAATRQINELIMLQQLTVLLLLHTCLLSFACQYWAGHEWSCDGRSVTYIITHYIDNGEELEYNATVVFHWGPTDTNLGSQTYSSDEINKETSTYQYDEEGEYNVGHTIIFEEGSGCEGRISESYTLLSLEDRWCAVVEFESSAPTLEPTEVSLFLLQLESSAPTPEPTDVSLFHLHQSFVYYIAYHVALCSYYLLIISRLPQLLQLVARHLPVHQPSQ